VAVGARGDVWVGSGASLFQLNGENGAVLRTVSMEGIVAIAIDPAGGIVAAHGNLVSKLDGEQKTLDGAARAMAIGADGAIYVAYANTVAKLGAGGFARDLGWAVHAMAVDGAGAVYVTGTDAKIAKLSPAGDRVAFLREPAGFMQQEGRGIAVDGSGNVHVAGWTNSSDFARAEGWHGDRDGFLLKLNAAGEAMETHFVGTAIRDELSAVAVTAAGEVYVAGWSEGSGMGSGPLAQLHGATDAIVVKFAADLGRSLTGTTTMLTVSPSGAATYGQAVTLTAAISPAGTTGKVTFYDGVNVLGTGTVSGGGASLTSRSLPSGTRQLRAYYQGDVNFSGSSSPVISMTVSSLPAAPFSAGVVAALTGAFPMSIAVADFNGDGRPDAAIANANSNNITVVLGTGLRSFAPAPGSPFAVGTRPQFVVAADWNGDGKFDLATANTDSNSVSILIGDGLGGFSPAAGSPIAFPSGPTALAVADFNLDGVVDMAVDAGGSSPSILLGSGDGTFVAAAASAGTPGRLASTVGDFNADGKPDLAVGLLNVFAPASDFSILLGNGSGGYVNPGNSSSNGTGTRNVVVADFNSDGMDDVAVFGSTNFTDSFLTIFLGNGTAGFTIAPGSPIALGGRCVDWLSAAVADYNGDGKPDIALTNATGSCGSATYPHG